MDNFYAEIKKRPRSIFRNIKFGFSTGYGNTYFSHQLDGFDIYQATGQPPSIFVTNSSPATVRIANWVNQGGTDASAYQAGSFTVSSSTDKIGFKGNALNIPFKGTIHYEWGGK